MAIVSIKRQQVTIYDADGWVQRAPVSTGMTGRETPAGVFSVVEKDKDHHSNLYDDASMPNMERITWSGIAMHGGPLPGYAASHGCVRMPYGFAEKLFDKSQVGMRVIIAPNDAEPVEFSDPGLLAPNAKAIAAAPARAETLAREASEAANTADEAKSAAAGSGARRGAARGVAPQAGMRSRSRAGAAARVRPRRCLPPPTRTRRRRRGPEAEGRRQGRGSMSNATSTLLRPSAKSKLDAAAAAQTAAKAAKAAEATAPGGEPRAEGRRQGRGARDASSAPPRPTPETETRRGRERRRTPPRRPRPSETGTPPRRRAMTRSSRSSRSRSSSAARRSGSMCGAALRQTSMVPVTIRNPDKPIGTHVFTAVARTDDGGLRWTGGHDRRRRQRQGRVRPRQPSRRMCSTSIALDRFAAILDRHLG